MLDHKATLLKGNESIAKGDHEGFLELCTEETIWEFVGDRTLKGKKAVREYMAEAYLEPPKFNVTDLIEAGDVVIAIGEIQLKEENEQWNSYSYCDIWRFEGNKMATLKAFVVPK